MLTHVSDCRAVQLFFWSSSFQCKPVISNLALISKAFPPGIYYLFNLLIIRVKSTLPNPVFFFKTCSEKENVDPSGSFVSGFQPAWIMSCWLDVASPFPAWLCCSKNEQSRARESDCTLLGCVFQVLMTSTAFSFPPEP